MLGELVYKLCRDWQRKGKHSLLKERLFLEWKELKVSNYKYMLNTYTYFLCVILCIPLIELNAWLDWWIWFRTHSTFLCIRNMIKMWLNIDILMNGCIMAYWDEMNGNLLSCVSRCNGWHIIVLYCLCEFHLKVKYMRKRGFRDCKMDKLSQANSYPSETEPGG